MDVPRGTCLPGYWSDSHHRWAWCHRVPRGTSSSNDRVAESSYIGPAYRKQQLAETGMTTASEQTAKTSVTSIRKRLGRGLGSLISAPVKIDVPLHAAAKTGSDASQGT